MPSETNLYPLFPLALAVGFDVGRSAKGKDVLREVLEGSLKGLYSGAGGVLTYKLLEPWLGQMVGPLASPLAVGAGIGSWYLLRQLIDKVLGKDSKRSVGLKRKSRLRPLHQPVAIYDPFSYTRTVMRE